MQEEHKKSLLASLVIVAVALAALLATRYLQPAPAPAETPAAPAATAPR